MAIIDMANVANEAIRVDPISADSMIIPLTLSSVIKGFICYSRFGWLVGKGSIPDLIKLSSHGVLARSRVLSYIYLYVGIYVVA